MMADFKTAYTLRSLVTGTTFEDKNWILDAPGEKEPSLLQSVYQKKQLELKGDQFGIYTFADWLPLHRTLEGSYAPFTYKSEGLGNHLGLENLYITFSGYWPDKNIRMATCSFKETEAYSVCARMRPEQDQVLVVASAGNTARAFARVCSDNQIPLLLSVPTDTLDSLWFDKPINEEFVTLIAPPAGCDYYDAIHLSNLVCQLEGYIPEGGAKNIARRDGMATTVLSAATTIGSIPKWYFQAVGSGTGAIAAWEANKRLIGDGRFGDHKMKLFLSQNFPFHPLVDAWEARSRSLLPMDDQKAREQVIEIDAKVLSNRRPPYSIIGGLFDALSDTDGELVFVRNKEAMEAAQLFEKLEGIDIHPAAAVATASLIDAVAAKKIPSGDVVMLNITGGGEARFAKDTGTLNYLKPQKILSPDISLDELSRELESLG
jgi:cysteate synthase